MVVYSDFLACFRAQADVAGGKTDENVRVGLSSSRLAVGQKIVKIGKVAAGS